MNAPRSRIVMVIPTYNEVDNLAWITDRVRASVPLSDVLVVDDAGLVGARAQ